MKEITVKMSEKVLKDLRSSIRTKHLGGNLFGVMDETLTKLIKSIDQGEKEVILMFKDEIKKGEKKSK